MKDKETNDYLISQVLNNPRALWEIKKSNKVVLGPWEKAFNIKKKIYYSNESECRFKPNGDFGIIVSESVPLEEPQSYLYENYDYFDEDAFLNAIAYYNEQLTKWKSWNIFYENIKFYADSKKEAKEMSDEYLKSNGILYFN